MAFKVGDTATYYDISMDVFTSREIIFISDGWVLLRRDKTSDGRCPWAIAPLSSLEHTNEDPIQVGSRVRVGDRGRVGEVLAVNAPAAWVRFDEEDEGVIVALSRLLHVSEETA